MSIIAEILSALNVADGWQRKGGLPVTSPHDGQLLASLATDTPADVSRKLAAAKKAQAAWAALGRDQRQALIEQYSAALKTQREKIGAVLSLEAGKTLKEAISEVDGAADVLIKTIKDATLPEFSGMLRRKERPPVGVVGLITSFNFPIAVAHWTLAPALLAGNGVAWKPSEKTPLTAIAAKAVFDSVAGAHSDLVQLVIGAREAGEALVADELTDMVSATGSVAMGQGIRKTLAAKKNRGAPPVLELGGNNGVVISGSVSPEHLAWSLSAILGSFLGTTGQRCTNTRRLFVHKDIYHGAVAILKKQLADFLAAHQKPEGFDPENPYGYAALIDADAWRRFEKAKAQAAQEGGEVLFGARLFAEKYPDAYYVEPALALLDSQTAVMHEETFAPLLYAVPYDTFEQGLSMLNAPENAGLVAAIYTQSQKEADRFAQLVQAGHALINPPKGTGTPAHGMGFGGNKHSGEGEILNSADPLQAFTRSGAFTRIAQNAAIAMDR